MIGKRLAKRKKMSKYIINSLIIMTILTNSFALAQFINNNNKDIITNAAGSTVTPALISRKDFMSQSSDVSNLINYTTELPVLYLSSSIDNIIEEKEVPLKEEPVKIIQEPIVEEEVKREPIPKLTRDTDLMAPIDITIEEMDSYIAAFGNTELKGYGEYFIDASEATGLNPLYLFGHASLESGFGSSDLAKYKGNYFGIGAYDCDPYNLAYNMGDTMYDGIIQGASWIKESYYDNGQTTLHEMIYGPKCYATSKEDWIWQIASLASSKLHVINDNR